MILLAGMYSGDLETGEALMQPLREVATPVMDLSGRWPYLGLQGAFKPLLCRRGLLLFLKRST